jgi:transcriptional regulator with XRE-family HTH domain
MDIRRMFGENIRRFRVQAGLSQEAVAERMGVDRAYVSSMERGQQNVTLLTLWHTAQALGVKPVDLLNEDIAVGGESTDPEDPSSS